MTRLDAIKELSEKVEAGELPTFPVTVKALGDDAFLVEYAFNGDLCPAMDLHETTLPECSWSITSAYRGDHPSAWIEGHCVSVCVESQTPARAWLLAILRALIAQEESK